MTSERAMWAVIREIERKLAKLLPPEVTLIDHYPRRKCEWSFFERDRLTQKVEEFINSESLKLGRTPNQIRQAVHSITK